MCDAVCDRRVTCSLREGREVHVEDGRGLIGACTSPPWLRLEVEFGVEFDAAFGLPSARSGRRMIPALHDAPETMRGIAQGHPWAAGAWRRSATGAGGKILESSRFGRAQGSTTAVVAVPAPRWPGTRGTRFRRPPAARQAGRAIAPFPRDVARAVAQVRVGVVLTHFVLRAQAPVLPVEHRPQLRSVGGCRQRDCATVRPSLRALLPGSRPCRRGTIVGSGSVPCPHPASRTADPGGPAMDGAPPGMARSGPLTARPVGRKARRSW